MRYPTAPIAPWLAILTAVAVGAAVLSLTGCTPMTGPTCSDAIADTVIAPDGVHATYGICLGHFR